MLAELIVRFVVGGLVVSAFAVIADLLRPKSFAGVFGAAPSVALATLGLTFAMHGGSYSGFEGRSMVVGAVAFLAYSLVIAWSLLRHKLPAVPTTSASWTVWLIVAFGLWGVFLR